MKHNRPRTPGQYSLPRSFGFALSGLVHALRHERNLRIDAAVAAYVIYFSRYYTLSRAERALLFLMIGFVLVCELLNTAIENTVDLETPEYHSLAKIAKDVAAGAVLVSAIASAAAGFCLFYDPPTLLHIWREVYARLPVWLVLACATAVWIGAQPKKRR